MQIAFASPSTERFPEVILQEWQQPIPTTCYIQNFGSAWDSQPASCPTHDNLGAKLTQFKQPWRQKG
ncbi:hypothetical protein CY34DRAFT_812211 [Suillus luteus UH-Slu-Lm8-n1]|uniref:Uncharacterized protein n=1 Tax=Suillus luteus UH-Slu-Lm8-n1 TaxID=930992 RepID=A0A0D0A0N5_9AGAM|nr:hypothetical protein CY34DRAFT_812211 [Suillus luteus UH-Slu-Lm8-n1]